jgi:cellulase (glycosyl hydrolase family 5)/glycosyl hydrolase family 5
MVSKEKINARQLYKDDNWFRDPYGRYVMFRGVNFGARSKLAPYLPISPLKAKMISPQELTNEIKSVTKELDLMKESGFNVVRFLLSWKALEPRPNTDLDHRLLPEGEEYLRLVRQIVDELYSRDILVLFDFHQDIAHELAGGDGFPDWALALHDQVKRPDKPAKNNKLWAASYQLNKLVKNTLSSFYHNDLTNDEENLSHYPVRTHLEKTIGQTIRFFKNLNGGEGHPAILGVDLFNEPHPVGIDKYEFESKLLKEFYLNAFHEIRKYDDKIFVFIEPRVDWTAFSSEEMNKQLTGWDKAKKFDLRRFLRIGDMEMVRTPLDKGTYTHKGLMDAPKEINTYLPGKADWPAELLERGVFSFHYYDTRAIMSSIGMIPDNISKYKQDWPDVFERIVTAGYERDLIPFLTEFGGTHESELVAPYINLQYIQVESQLLNSTYWNYDLYHTEDGKDNWNLENFSLLGPRRKQRHLDLATRPYPILSSSKPVFLSFDVKNKYFSLVLQGGGNATASEGVSTVIYIPRIIHYQNGFNVWSTTKSRESIEWDPVDQLLYWNPTKELGPDILLITGTEDIDANKLHNEVRNSFSDLTPLGRIV